MKKLNKFWAILLAFALVVTTFGSDYATAHVYAADGETESEDKSGIFEDVSDDSKEDSEEDSEEEDNDEEEVVDENNNEENDGENNEEGPADGQTVEGQPVDGQPTEGQPTEGESTEEVSADASSTDLSDDAALLGSSEVIEVTEEEEEEEEVVFDQSKQCGDILVSLYAVPGVLPADAELQVDMLENKEDEIADVIEDVLPENQQLEETISFDINIYSPSEDRYVQPDGGKVRVKFTNVEAAKDPDINLSVYHVNDSITDADPVASASDKTADTIQFNTKHFSIYTITLTSWQGNLTSFKINVVDEDGKSLGKNEKKSVSTVSEGMFSSWRYASVVDVANQLNLSKNILKEATIDGKQFDYFYYNTQSGKLQTYRDMGDFTNEFPMIAEVKKDSVITFTFGIKEKNSVLVDHADLRFVKTSDVNGLDENPKVFINGVEYNMTYYGMDVTGIEYRHTRDTKNISSKSEIYFVVKINGVTYSTKEQASEKLNLEAYERCASAHGYAQAGFDFEFDSKAFKMEGAVTYFKNDKGVAQANQSEKKEVKVTGDNISSKIHNVLSYADTKLSSRDGYEFLGWNEKPDGTGKSYKIGDPITVKNKDTYSLYAIWSEAPKVTVTVTGGEWTYDGTTHTAVLNTNNTNYKAELKANSGTLASAKDYTATPVASNVTANDIIIKKDGKVVTNAVVTVNTDSRYKGKVTINKRPVTLKSIDLSKEYDGTALTVAERIAKGALKQDAVIVTGVDGFIDGEGIDKFSYTGSLLGERDKDTVQQKGNTFTYTLKKNTKADNYEITPVYGDLKVTKAKTVTVSFYIDNKHLQGKDQTLIKGVEKATELVAGTDYENKVSSGYTFDGWYEKSDFKGPKYDFTKVVDKDKQLYARWIGNVSSYKVEYYYADKNGKYPEKPNKEKEVKKIGKDDVRVGNKVTVKPEPDDLKYGGYDYTLNKNKSINTEFIVNVDTTKNVAQLYFDRSGGLNVEFYVLKPNMTVPSDGSPQPTKNYHPDANQGWIGKAKELKNYSDYPIYDRSGAKINEQIISVPAAAINSDASFKSQFGSNVSADDIVWYVYKREGNGYATPHIDGYVTGVNVQVVYHRNDGVTPEATYTDATTTGEYTILGSGEAAKDQAVTALTQNRIGWEFKGWATTAEPVANEKLYTAGESYTLMTSQNFYARWDSVTVDQDYTVEYYYQKQDGSFPETADSTFTRTATIAAGETEAEVSITAEDKAAVSYNGKTYKLVDKVVDGVRVNGKWEGTVTYTDSEVLKVYFERGDFDNILYVQAASESFDYDGKAHNKEEATGYARVGDSNTNSSDYVVTATAAIDGTAGKTISTVAENAENNNKVTSIHVVNNATKETWDITVSADGVVSANPFKQVVITNGTVSINPIYVDVTVPDAQRYYDGTEFTAEQYAQYLSDNAQVVSYVAAGKADGYFGQNFDLKDGKAVISVDGNIKNVKRAADDNSVLAYEDAIKISNTTEIYLKGSTTPADYEFATAVTSDGTVASDKSMIVRVNAADVIINPRTVTLTSKNLQKQIDLKPLTADERYAAGQLDARDLTATTFDAATGAGFVAGEGVNAQATKFTGSRTKVGGKDLQENTFTYVLADNTTLAQNYDITTVAGDLVVTDRTPDNRWKITVTIKADADGNGPITHKKYNGGVQEGNKNIVISADSETSVVVESVQGFLSNLATFGSIIANAEEDDPAAPKKVDAQRIKVPGTDIMVEVDNLYVSGGAGTHVLAENGYYPIYLDESRMTIRTTMDGEEVELQNQFQIVIEGYGEIPVIEPKSYTADGQEINPMPVPDVEGMIKEVGALYIDPREVTLKSQSQRFRYDGNYHSYKHVTEGGDKFVNDEGAVYSSWASIRSGRAQNTFSYDLQENTLELDYDIDQGYGTLEVYTSDTIDNPPTEEETPSAPVPGAVLGAKREDGAAVLGARRGGTDDSTTSRTTRLLIIIIAAGAVATFIITGRRSRKSEEE